MSEDEKPIRVVDRRMFTSEGDLRPDYQAEDVSPAPEAAAPARPTEAAPADQGRGSEPSRAPSEPPREELPAEPRGAFALIVQILAMPAYAALGLVPDPASGRRRIDRAAAQEMIDLLAALERKTKGNLSFEESTFLSRILTELRLAFVDVTRPPAK